MRTGTLDGVTTPTRLIDTLPGLYQEDDLSSRLLSSFDEVLAPVVVSLDGLPGYLDPAITPHDFLDWLAGWVGVLLDENWPIQRRRAFVANAAELFRHRGTVKGLAGHVRIFTGGQVEIEETGEVRWSARSGSTVPGRSGYHVNVRVRGADGPVDGGRLEALVASAKPAHVTHAVETIG